MCSIWTLPLINILTPPIPHPPFPRLTLHLKGQLLLDLRNRQSGVQPLGARPRAVQNRVASVQAHAIVQRRLSLFLLLVTRIGKPSVALEQDSGSEVLLRVPPVAGAGG